MWPCPTILRGFNSQVCVCAAITSPTKACSKPLTLNSWHSCLYALNTSQVLTFQKPCSGWQPEHTFKKKKKRKLDQGTQWTPFNAATFFFLCCPPQYLLLFPSFWIPHGHMGLPSLCSSNTENLVPLPSYWKVLSGTIWERSSFTRLTKWVEGLTLCLALL